MEGILLKTATITILLAAGVAIISILMFYHPGLLSTAEEEPKAKEVEITADENGANQPEENDIDPNLEEAENGEFKITENPYQAYNEALDQGLPMVVEFYADW